MPEFVKPTRKVVKIEDAFGELIGKTLVFVLFVMVPASASKIILMGCLTTPIREPATSPTSTSLSGSARTVITVSYVIAPTVESRFRGTEHFATATPLCSAASRKKAAKKKNGSKKQKSTSRMRSGRCL